MMLLFHTDRYMMFSEPQFERRFGDLFMLLRLGMRHIELYDILFEFKRLSANQATEDVITRKGETVKRALGEEALRNRPSDELKKLANIETAFDEAKNQLNSYRQKLIKERREDLRLRCYAVVSVGFDRILWDVV